MDSEPPPITPKDEEDAKSDNSDDLFKSAIEPPKDPLTADVMAPKENILQQDESSEIGNNSSGYESVVQPVRSDTMDDVNLDESQSPKKEQGGPPALPQEEEEDEDDEDIFKSTRGLEPNSNDPSPPALVSPQGVSAPPAVVPVVIDSRRDSEVPLEDEDERPFENAHLKPQFQLSGDNNKESPSVSSLTSGFVGSAGGFTNGNQDENQRASSNGNQSVLRTTSGGGNSYDEAERTEAELGDDFMEIKVTNPHKIGEGMSSYVAYRVETRTNINYFKKKENAVTRRFSDFLGLHDKLTEKYVPNGRIVPPAPDKNLVGTTKIKMTKEMTDTTASTGRGSPEQNEDSSNQPDEFLERRRAALERFLNRTAAHASLKTDPDFREFLELQAELPKSNQTAALSGKNVMKLINKVGDKVNSITLKMEETDEWFEEKQRVIDQLDHQLRRLHGSTESLFEYRRHLALMTGSVARSLAQLSQTEENTQLSGALAQLSTVEEKIQHVHFEQARADFYELSELIRDYIGLVGAIKDVFQERVKAWQNWQTATSSLTRKREALVKAELAQRSDKVGQFRQEIVDQERQQEMAQENFEKISRLIKKEVEVFDVNKVHDFKKSLLAYLQVMQKSQDEISTHWERYIPEIKQINHN